MSSAIQQAQQDDQQGAEINLMALPIQQLRTLQQQFTQQMEVMTREFGNLKLAHSRFQNSLSSLDDMVEKNDDAEILMPLSSSIYVPAKVKDIESLLVDIGTGYLVEKSREDAAVYLKGKLTFLQGHLTAASDQINRTQATLDTINQALRERMQLALQAQMQQEAAGGSTIEA